MHDPDAVGCEGVRRQVVLEVQNPPELSLVNDRHAKDRFGPRRADVGVPRKPLINRGIAQNDALSGFANVVDDGLRKKIRSFLESSRLEHPHLVAVHSPFGLYPERSILLSQEEPSLRAGVFQSDLHEFAQEIFEDDFDGDGVGSF